MTPRILIKHKHWRVVHFSMIIQSLLGSYNRPRMPAHLTMGQTGKGNIYESLFRNCFRSSGGRRLFDSCDVRCRCLHALRLSRAGWHDRRGPVDGLGGGPGHKPLLFPSRHEANGAAGPRSINWTSKYGSVGCAFYEAGTVDGMNERGLVANVLYLVESDYGKPDGRKPTLSITAWGQICTGQLRHRRRGGRIARQGALCHHCPDPAQRTPLPRVIFRCRIRRATRPSSSISAADFTFTMDASIR